MKKPEFDKYAKQYDQIMATTIPEELNEDAYFAEYKIALMAEKLKSSEVKRILDYGCGAGRSLPYLEKYFPTAELWAYDVSPTSLQLAGQRSPATRLLSDWQDVSSNYFDVILSANVYHHIPPDKRIPALKQCHHALNKTGKLFLFEHNPYNPATRWIFERCPFDVDAEMLSLKQALTLSSAAGFHSEKHGYTLFFPRQLALFRGIEPYIKWIPIGAQYYVEMGS